MESGNRPDADPPFEVVGSGAAAVRWWLWPNILSLDAPLVAVAWLWLLSATASVRIPEPLWCYGILAAAVWVIYLSDRLLDGMAVGDERSLTARHRFYRNNPFPFILLAAGAAAFAIYGVLYHAPATLLWHGIVVSFVSLFYLMQCAGARLKNPALNMITVLSAASVVGILVLQATFVPNWMRMVFLAIVAFAGVRLAIEPGGSFFHALPKEIFCGIAFAAGVSLPVLSVSVPLYRGELTVIYAMLLGGLFSLNCIAIALYEEKNDEANDPVAITKLWPRIRNAYPFLVAALIALSAGIAYLHKENGIMVFPLAVALGALLLGILHFSSDKFGSVALRVLADLALLVPPALLLFGRSFWV